MLIVVDKRRFWNQITAMAPEVRFKEHTRRAGNLTEKDWTPFKRIITDYHTLKYSRAFMIESLKIDHGFIVS